MWNTVAAISKTDYRLFYGFGAVVLLSIITAVATGFYYIAGLPALLLLVWFTMLDFRKPFFLLLACLPLSTEIYLPNGFGTDLPSEPLMVGLAGAYVLYAFRHPRFLDGRFFRHPITLLLLLHVGWILVTTLTSSLVFVSFKFLLAKIWYVLPFYFLAGLLLRRPSDVRQYFWWVFIPLLGTIFYALAKHSAYGFSFEFVHKAFHPFYRNHVNYAAIIALFVPFIWFVRQWYPRYSLRWLLLAGALLLMLVAIQLSYTRAAYVAIFIAMGSYFIIRWRLMRAAVAGALVGAIALVALLAVNNRYLDYAPNYDRTITHTDFNNLIEATYQLEDISTMERVYRWIAGFYMSKDKPVVGFGPGNFYNFYWPYTVTSFQTYVSDNPEKSGIHSYYLMTLVEQGYTGLFLFLLMLSYVLIRGERIYYETQGRQQKQVVMIALLMIIVISGLQIINDLLEVDKVGPFFFMAMAILVNADLQNRAFSDENQVVD
ncbi:MAG TPA: O-antigen ligase family protein [Saprospiraceae bacterium]|nr:O-antigen ligase family protein [Saprospiraceae bacterium]HMP23797.1 O-antigen ligase family protein [Saprospiraceae bacterium]